MRVSSFQGGERGGEEKGRKEGRERGEGKKESRGWIGLEGVDAVCVGGQERPG